MVIIVIGILIFNYFQRNTQTQVGKEGTQTTNEEKVKLIEEEGKMVPEGLPTTYKVVKGDHLWAIAEKFYGSGYNWVDIAKENKLKNANKLLIGQELTIPKAAVKQPKLSQAGPAITGSTYTVVKGDSLWKIALRAYGDGFKWPEIAKTNNLKNPDLLYIGTVLTLPR